MTIDKTKFQWNLNTIIHLITLASVIVGGVTLWVNQSRDIDELEKWRASHEAEVKDRYAETKAFRAKVEEGTQSQRLDIAQYQRKTDNVEYRLTVLETATASQAEEQQKMTERLSEISGDLKVVKELLVRMDAASKRATR